ncbi:MAG TPA: glycosyltransferase family 2 protein [Armatimonadota bacterium]
MELSMELSIIIVNWNTSEYLRRCLESIITRPFAGECEVIVADNCSKDSSAQMVRDEFPEVVLIANDHNLGYAAGNNQGIRRSSGEYVLLLNPDTEVKEGTLDTLVQFLKNHRDAGAVACRLIGPDGKVQSSCRSFPDPAGVMFEYSKLSRLFPQSRVFGRYRMTYFDYETEVEVDQPMASCLMLTRKALDDVGMIDEEFPIFFNEVDWLFRAKQKGWKVYFTPETEIIHHGGASTRQVKPEMVRESHRSLAKFYRKHYRSRIFPPLYWFIMAAISLNCFASSRFRRSG